MIALPNPHDVYDPSGDAIEFRQTFNQPLGVPIQSETAAMQIALIAEEVEELFRAYDLCKLSTEPEHISDMLKEGADVAYVLHQFFAAIGLDLDEALRRVHVSNMSKVHPDGTVKYRDDGKVLKPDTYQPPTLIDLV